MDESYEMVDLSLEDLLIFPTEQGLRRSMGMIEAYFSMEVGIMQKWGTEQRQNHYESIIHEHEAILNIAKIELNKSQAPGSSCATESCWAPKKIDGGIDKNVAAQLASAFEGHADRFNDINE